MKLKHFETEFLLQKSILWRIPSWTNTIDILLRYYYVSAWIIPSNFLWLCRWKCHVLLLILLYLKSYNSFNPKHVSIVSHCSEIIFLSPLPIGLYSSTPVLIICTFNLKKNVWLLYRARELWKPSGWWERNRLRSGVELLQKSNKLSPSPPPPLNWICLLLVTPSFPWRNTRNIVTNNKLVLISKFIVVIFCDCWDLGAWTRSIVEFMVLHLHNSLKSCEVWFYWWVINQLLCDKLDVLGYITIVKQRAVSGLFIDIDIPLYVWPLHNNAQCELLKFMTVFFNFLNILETFP